MRLSQIRPPNPHTLGAGCSVSGGARDFGPATPYCGKKAQMPRGSFRAPPNVCFQQGFRTGFAVAKRQGRAQPGQPAPPAPAPAPAAPRAPAADPHASVRHLLNKARLTLAEKKTILRHIKSYFNLTNDDIPPRFMNGPQSTLANINPIFNREIGRIPVAQGGGFVETVDKFLKKHKVLSRTAEAILPLITPYITDKYTTPKGDASAGYMGRTAVKSLKSMGYGVPGRGASTHNSFDSQSAATSLSGAIPFEAPNHTFSGAGASSLLQGSNMKGLPSRKVEPVIFSTTWAPDQPAMNGVALRYYVGWDGSNPVV